MTRSLADGMNDCDVVYAEKSPADDIKDIDSAMELALFLVWHILYCHMCCFDRM